ncbi:MAG: hypothetical protein AUI14_26005 [Actinobacteria bacterium 13_2_20CM_2_71_6]|nr:MAG: hypothetical protein AUI14_26005 [Actinobacteria bacterium 13_2_20CM_2_71_6]
MEVRHVAGSPLVRRTVVGLTAVALATLAGTALPAAAHTRPEPGTPAMADTPAMAEQPGTPAMADKKTPRPKPSHPGPTDTPTPTATPTDPTQSSSESNPPPGPPGGGPAPGHPAGPSSSGPAGPAPRGIEHGGAGIPVPANGSVEPGSSFYAPPQPGNGTTLAGVTRPLWPVLGGGTALVVVVTTGLLLALRERRAGPRPAVAVPVAGTVPADDVQEPDQPVPSPRGPIKVEWTEPPG